MEKFLLKKEKTFGVIFAIIYFLIVIGSTIELSTEVMTTLEQDVIDYNLFTYAMAMGILLYRIINEVTVYNKLNRLDAVKLSGGVEWYIKLKIAFQIIAQIAFWLSYSTENRLLMMAIMLFISYCLPTIITSGIYGTDEYLVENGCKYFYQEIVEWSVTKHDRILLETDKKTYGITSWDEKERIAIVDYLEHKIPVSRTIGDVIID